MSSKKLVIPIAKGAELGLGDVIKIVTDKLGIKQCPGCKRRQDMLNKIVIRRKQT